MAETHNEDRKKVSPEQLTVLLAQIEKNPLLMTPRTNTKIGKKSEYSENWKTLAKTLNSIGGPVKSVTKWQQAWRDWKWNTKKKANNAGQELTNQETRVLALIDGEAPDAKPIGIDIKNIVEIDPLSADNSTSSNYTQNLDSSETITVYTADVNNGNGKRPLIDNTTMVKRHRVPVFLDTRIAQQTSEILARVTSLESSRIDSNSHLMRTIESLESSLEGIESALDRQAAATEIHAASMDRQLEAMERQTAAIQNQVNLMNRLLNMLERIHGAE